jgi:hypothetical protein
MVNRRTNAAWICAMTLCAVSFVRSESTIISDGATDDVSFQILTEKVEYKPAEKAVVRLILVNRASEPIYISRWGVDLCGKGSGFADLAILDGKGQKVPMLGCSVAELSIPVDKLKERIVSSGAWIKIGRGEIYGSEVSVEMPQQQGRYRLISTIHPPSFSKQQAELLKEGHIHVLQSTHDASPVAILVK